MFYIGTHTSIINIEENIEEIKKLGGNIIQVFVSNPMAKQKQDIIEKYKTSNIKKLLKKNNFKLVIHFPYIFNISKQDIEKNIVPLYNELIIAKIIGSLGCVIHVGKQLDLDLHDAKRYMFLTLQLLIKKILEDKLNVKIYLETAAGQGTEILSNLEELKNFYNKFTKKEKNILKLCIDTCHIYSAGYDINNYEIIDDIFKLFKKDIGLIHLNNSKTVLNSHVDRHENIKTGTIDKKALLYFAKKAKKNNIPVILETPNYKYEEEIPYIIKNI